MSRTARSLHHTVRRAGLALLVLAAAAAATAPASAQRYARRYQPENSVRVRVGLFEPRAESDYFDEKFRDFTGSKDDLQDAALGVEYVRELMPMLDLMIGGTFYETAHDQAYRDFEDSRDRPIFHTLNLERTSFDIGVRLKLAPPHAPLTPYIGGGGSFVSWALREDGDFIDFSPPPPQIFDGILEAEGETFGYYLVAGVEVPLGNSWAIFAEGRYHDAEDDLNDDFEDFGKIDLAATEYSAGVSLRF